MLEEYIPLVIAVIMAAVVAIVFFLANRFIGARKRSFAKERTYESGMLPFGTARKRFSVKFYLVAISFIIFDVEAFKSTTSSPF